MANHTATEKAIRKTETKTLIRKSRLSRIRTYIKKVEHSIEVADITNAKSQFIIAQSEIMRGVKKKVFTANSASRKVSKLSAKIKELELKK